jgi:hypothetical protein
VAPASVGADAHADHESAAGVGDERRLSLEEKTFSEQGRAQLEKLALAPCASRRRQELLELLDRMNPTIEELTAAVDREARMRPEALRLMTHPGVGPLTALAYVLIQGAPFWRGSRRTLKTLLQTGRPFILSDCRTSAACSRGIGDKAMPLKFRFRR